jgi:hypothetical protein
MTPFEMSGSLGLRRALSVLVLASTAFGCHVVVHNHGRAATAHDGKNGKDGKDGKDGSAGTGSEGKSDKPKDDKPKDDKPKSDKPKDPPPSDKPKGDKPKDPPKSDKPSTDKPPTDKPTADKPKPDPEKPVELPPHGISRLTVPVRAPFEKLVEHVDALLPKTQSQDYKRVTKEGDNAVLEVKYKAWRDPIEAKFKGRTLTVTVPVRYAANIRGKVKNPLGSDYFPLVDGQTWGTSSSPQRMRVTVSLELDVNDEWKLTSESKLESIEHGSVPTGNFCAKVGIDVCTPKENLAGEVRKHVEDYLVPKIKKELAKADKEIEKALDLRAQASALWAGLQKPLQLQKVGDKTCPTSPENSCTQEAWLVFAPKSLGLSELSLHEGDLGVDVGLEGKLSTAVGKKPKVKVQPLPKPAKPEGPTAFQLRASLEVPLKVFGKDLAKALSGAEFSSGKHKLEIREVTLTVKRGEDVKLSLETKGAYDGKLTLSGKLVLDKKKGEVALEKVTFDEATKKLLDKELKELDEKALREKIEKEAHIAIGKDSKALRQAVTRALDGALPGQLEVKGTLGDVSFLDLDVDDDALKVDVELSGSLRLEYKL